VIQGFVQEDFRPVAEQLQKQLETGAEQDAGGAAVCVYHAGERVVDIWAGAKSPDLEWESDTVALSFSTTKGVMATLVHTLVDRGLLDYDDPVAKYWPEFAQAGKEAITVRQILSHQAGLYPIRSLIDHADRMLDWEYMTAALAAAKPIERPGKRSGYHGITYGWLVGELIRRVTKTSLKEAMATLLIEPLELDGVFLGAPVEARPRLATLIQPTFKTPTLWSRVKGWFVRALSIVLGLDPGLVKEALLPHGCRETFFSDRMLDAEVPAMNGVFTARSLARMYAMLAGGGLLEGKRFLSEKTLRRATKIHSRWLDAVVGFPMRWRLGYHLVGTHRGILPNAFGHFGYGGSGAWADPDRNLSLAMTLNRVAGTPFGDMRMVTMGGIVAKCAEKRARQRRLAEKHGGAQNEAAERGRTVS
jgi:CubicO group peptidase (beta-lactamase class C family)